MILKLADVTSIWLSRLSENNLLSLSILALLFSLMRFSEAVGIWFNQNWAEWLAVLTGVASAIFFTHRLMDSFEWTVTIFLIVNVLVILYLLHVLLKKRYKLAT